jgi:hypothetical protein
MIFVIPAVFVASCVFSHLRRGVFFFEDMSKYNGNVTIGGVALSELTLDSNNRKKNATILKAGYTVAKRRFELLVKETENTNQTRKKKKKKKKKFLPDVCAVFHSVRGAGGGSVVACGFQFGADESVVAASFYAGTC